jgi:hypothetical protein
MVAVPAISTVPPVTLKLAVEASAPIVTEFGTVTIPLLEESATVAPPAGAGPESVTEQLDATPDATDVGEHCNVDTLRDGETGGGAGVSEILAPVPETAIAAPLGSTPVTLLSGSETEPLAAAVSVAVTTATTPLPIVLEFKPYARHVAIPAA